MRKAPLLAIAGSLGLALAFGPLCLLVAPFLFGMGHLSSTTRVLARLWGPTSAQNEIKALFIMSFLALCLIRLSPWRAAFYPGGILVPELFLLLVCFAWGLRSQTSRFAPYFLIPAAVGFGFYFSAVITVAALVFLHNLLAFVYWYRLSLSAVDKRSALIGGLSLLALSALIALGGLDKLMWSVPFEGLNTLIDRSGSAPVNWAKSTLPFVIDSLVIYRWLVIAAFGQLAHYFVWLYEIPKIPAERAPAGAINLATKTLMLGGGAAVVGLALFDPGLARIVYIAIAAGHGFVELGSLPLLAPSKATLNG
jgi:hypothetical protein